MRARRSSNSARTRSVPWRRSTKGETTARRKSTHPGLLKLRGRLDGSKLHGGGESRQAEQDAQEQPEIGGHHEILIRLDSGITNGGKKNSRVPQNHEAYGKPRRAPQPCHYAPRGRD